MPPTNSVTFSSSHARSSGFDEFHSAHEIPLMSARRSSGFSSRATGADGKDNADPDTRADELSPGCGSGGVLNHGHGPFGSNVRVSNAARQLPSSPVWVGLPVPMLLSGRVPLSQSGNVPPV